MIGVEEILCFDKNGLAISGTNFKCYPMHLRHPNVLAGPVLHLLLAYLACSMPLFGDDVTKAKLRADLPPVLQFLDGEKVGSSREWQERRSEIMAQWCETYLGNFPKRSPSLLESQVLDEEERKDGVRVRHVRLTFDTPNKRSFEIRLLLPKTLGDADPGGFPLLLTQPRYYQIAWGEAAVRRGYVACFYPGLDVHHHEKDFPGFETVWRLFQSEYPEASWCSSLGIQSWLAGRALDYLLSHHNDVKIDAEKVGIIGHSRYGKQSLYAAAFDQRIKAVVYRSAGSPAAAGYRFTGRETFMETVMDAPKAWALDGVKDYFGRENALPVESNGLLALIAPRACLIHTAYNDGSDPSFAVERTYLEAKKAFRLLGEPEKLGLLYRKGNHNPITDAHIKVNLDWFDWAFGRAGVERSEFPERLLHDFDWKFWRQQQDSEAMLPPGRGSGIKDRLEWMSGQLPKAFDQIWQGPLRLQKESEYGVAPWSRDRWKPEGVVRMPVSFGAHVHGNLAYPVKHSGPLPVVIWLHPFNYSHGSNEGYGVEGTTIYYRLAQAGYAVLSYDQCGFGDRLLEGAAFYEKYPKWSKLGRMVFDVQSALDFVHGLGGISDGKLPGLDVHRVVLVGYSLGGMVALHTAAMDERVKGVATFCGFTPMRTDHDFKPTGGIRRWWEWHGLLPKLGLFHGKEPSLPYDYDDLLGALGQRPCLVYSARKDRHADADEVAVCVARAQSKSSQIKLIQADDVNRFQSRQHQLLMEWLKSIH